MKKIFVMMVALAMILMAFAGCTQQTADTTDAPKDTQKTETKSTEDSKPAEPTGPVPGVYPIPGDHEFVYWVALTGNTAAHFENWADTPFYQQVMADTGVNVKFEHPVAGQEKESLNLLIASGDYPDIIEYNWVSGYPGGPAKAMDDGFMMDLTDMMPEYAPSLYNYLQSLPQVDRMVKTDAGQYYCFPFMRDISNSDALLVFFGPIIRQNYLDELGMDVPETMEDWYTMLTAMKQELGVETPLTYQWWMRNVAHNFVSAYGTINDFYMRDGQVQFGPAEAGFKDYLTEFSKWFAEGLIDPDIATVDKAQVTAKITGGDAGATMGYTASRLGSWTQSMQETDPTYKLVAAPHPVLNAGDTPMYGQKDKPYPGGASAIITDKCEEPEVAMIFMDYLYSEDGHNLVNFGIEGESYEWVDGYPTYTDWIQNHPEGWPVNEAMGAYNRANSGGPFIQDERYFINNYVKADYQLHAVDIWSQTDVDMYQLPPLTPTPEESEEYAAIMSDINTYKDEMFLKYLFGQESLDTFDEYVQNMKDMGLERAIELRQAALDRFNAR